MSNEEQKQLLEEWETELSIMAGNGDLTEENIYDFVDALLEAKAAQERQRCIEIIKWHAQKGFGGYGCSLCGYDMCLEEIEDKLNQK